MEVELTIFFWENVLVLKKYFMASNLHDYALLSFDDKFNQMLNYKRFIHALHEVVIFECINNCPNFFF